MPVTIRRLDGLQLTVILFQGLLGEEELVESLALAIEQKAMPPGASRIVLFPPDVRIGAVDIAAQARIQEIILRNEAQAEGGPTFRSALVIGSPELAPSARLFKAMYDLRGHPGLEVEVFEGTQPALEWLGAPPDALDRLMGF